MRYEKNRRGLSSSAGLEKGEQLPKFRLMEFVPVVEVVQINRIGTDRAGVRDGAGFQDAGARVVIVDVARNGDIQLMNGSLVELHARLLLHPGFELRIRRLAVGDELLDGVRV